MGSRLGAALAAAFVGLLCSCGPATDGVGDRYYGTIDPSTLDSKLKPSTKCPTGISSCYSPQQVSLHGQFFTERQLRIIVRRGIKHPPGNANLPVQSPPAYDAEGVIK